jgi:hypothetical protein
VTTYAGVSHTKLARDLFDDDDDDHHNHEESGEEMRRKRYVLEEWVAAPESFICQEQRQASYCFFASERILTWSDD